MRGSAATDIAGPSPPVRPLQPHSTAQESTTSTSERRLEKVQAMTRTSVLCTRAVVKGVLAELAAAMLLTMVASGLWAQEEPPVEPPAEPAPAPDDQPAEPAEPSDTVKFDLPDPMDVRILVEWVGEQLKLKMIYDEQLSQAGTVTVKPNQDVKVDELYHLLETVLHLKGFAMMRAGDWVRILPATDTGPDRPFIMPGEAPPPPPGDMTVNEVIKIKEADPKDVQDALTPYLSEQGSLFPMPDLKVIIVTEYKSRLDELRKIIEMVDVPPKEIIQRTIELVHTKAPDIAYKLSNYLTAKNQPRTRVVPVRTVTAAGVKINYTPVRVQPEVQPFIDVDERTNRLLIYGRPEDISELDELIALLDVKRKELQTIKAYPLVYLLAQDAWTALEALELAEPRGAAPRSTTTRAPATRVSTAPARATVAQDVGGTGAAPRIALIENTNTLIISATPEEHERIAAFLAMADVPMEERDRIRPYPVSRRKATEVADWLKAVFKADTVDPRTRTPVPGVEGAPIIVAVEDTNSVIVNATPSQHLQIEHLIRSLDATQPQVLLECMLIEVTNSDDFDVGLELENLTISGSRANGDQLFTSSSFEMSARDPATGLRVLTSVDPGGTIAYLNDGIVNVLLHAIEEKSKGRILSKPRVLVENNAEGKITATDMEPTVTVETLDQVTTRRFAGYQEAGTTLTITPRISAGDFLTLEIATEVSTFTGPAVDAGIPPPKALRNITTSIVVPDQRTVVIGGLTGKRKLESENKIPILGDIPFVGELFKRRTTEDARTTIYLFVKASILRDTTFTDLGEETDRARDALPPDLTDMDEQLSHDVVAKELARMEELRRRREEAKARLDSELLKLTGDEPAATATPDDEPAVTPAPVAPPKVTPRPAEPLPVETPSPQPREPAPSAPEEPPSTTNGAAVPTVPPVKEPPARKPDTSPGPIVVPLPQ